METQAVQLSLFDERHLAEVRAQAYPGDRLVVCHNPMLAEYRRRKREDLLAAPEEKLAKIAREVARRTEAITREAQLDGFYILRTSEPDDRLPTAEVVRSYKNLTNVERAFRSLKTVDLQIRPIRHRTETRIRAHLFLCLLSYYVEWHLRRALAPLLFDDEDLEAHRARRDPVLAAQPSESAKRKKARLQRLTEPTLLQRRAMELVKAFPVTK